MTAAGKILALILGVGIGALLLGVALGLSGSLLVILALTVTMLFRREIASIKDIWQVVGLRGTGSDAYSVQDLCVDDAHTITRDRPEERREPGLIYRFAAMQIYASGFAAVALGTARAALDLASWSSCFTRSSSSRIKPLMEMRAI